MEVDYLLDSTVLIDLFRKYSPAISWLEQNAQSTFGLPGFVALELLQGARNKGELDLIRKHLEEYPLFWPSEDDCNQALATFAALRLQHGLSVLDALIAHTAIGIGAVLLSHNTKHFSAIPNLRVHTPY